MMSDTKWELIAAHLKEVENQESETYVNTLKGWLNEYDEGDDILNEAIQQWEETQPDWCDTLLETVMGSDNTKLPKPPPDTDIGGEGSGDNQPVD
jgi:hypothetical protein